MKLTVKQEKFCQLYVETGNASEAYRQSYNCSRMKEKSVWELSNRLINKVNVRSRIENLRKNAAKRNEVTINELIGELARFMRFNPKSLIDDSGKVRNINELPDEVAKVIQEITVTETHIPMGDNEIVKVNTKYKLYSKLDAIDKLAKHLGFYEKDNRQKEQQSTVIILPSNNR